MRLLLLAALLLATPALAQDKGDSKNVEDRAEDVLRQPVKDLGLLNEKIDPLLLQAEANPYSLKGLSTCKALRAEVARFNAVLGPDIDTRSADGRTLAQRLADEGPGAVAGLLIPFRGLVREATGAADAQRKARVAVTSGIARRAFLKGVMTGRGCK